MPHASSIKLNLPQCLEAFYFVHSPSHPEPLRLLKPVHRRNACHHMRGHITCPNKPNCGTTYSRSGPTRGQRYLAPYVRVSMSLPRRHLQFEGRPSDKHITHCARAWRHPPPHKLKPAKTRSSASPHRPPSFSH